MESDGQRVLLVEDEPVTRMMLDARLRAAGHRVVSVSGAEEALALLKSSSFAVMVTDLLLERIDGVTLMVEAREIDPELEMIVLTGAPSIESAIAAVHNGVHTYLRKPARGGELEGRVAAALERRRVRLERQALLKQLGVQLLRIAEPPGATYEVSPGPERLRLGRLELDLYRRQVTVDRQVVPLSSGEFDLLVYLARRDSQVLSPEQIAREALGIGPCSPAEARELVKVRVHRLRQKIERNPRAPGMLVSVRGAGYMLVAGE